MTRRVIKNAGDWDAMRAGFKWDVPENFNIAERCCDSWANSEPDRVAIIDVKSDGSVRNWTYGDLKRASDRLAASFRAEGLGRGDRVAVLLPQRAEVMIAHFAAMKLGAVILPLFTLFGEDALQYRLHDSGARFVVTDDENVAKINNLRAALPDLQAVYLIGEDERTLSFWDEIDNSSPAIAPLKTLADDPAVLIYTSGTTGPPKGVLHAHRFLIGHLPSVEVHHPEIPASDDVGWTPADWAWIGGLMDLAMPCLYYGVPLVAHRMRKFDAPKAFDLIARFNVTRLFLPPTALKMMRLVNVPDGVNIRSIGSGGESLGSDLLAWGRDALGAPINEIYGQTECNLVLASCAGSMVVRDGSMGRAVPGFDVAVIDDKGQELGPDEMGEIAVRLGTPVMFLRYWNKPEQTCEKFVNGWLRTGDLGTCDRDGYFTFCGRDDDVITSAGYRIGPTEIENCLCAHEAVLMAAVIGVPDAKRTEAVKAFVVLREGVVWDGLEQELIARIREKISPHVAPRMIVSVKSLPMTATGKIMRKELRK